MINKYAKQKAFKSTLVFMPIVYLLNAVINPIISGESISGDKALKGIPLVLIAGVIYFFILYYFEKKYPKK